MKSILYFLVCVNFLSATDEPVFTFINNYCTKCHDEDLQKGDLRLDIPQEELLKDLNLLKNIVNVLSKNEMPPAKKKQPSPEEKDSVIKILTQTVKDNQVVGLLKRITREEYNHIVNDTFNVKLDLKEMLPKDHSEHGFNRSGSHQTLSPYAMMQYIKAANYVSQSLFPDRSTTFQTKTYGVPDFNGTQRGDYKTNDAFVLTTNYPWRSNLHVPNLKIEEFGEYHFEYVLKILNSDNQQIIGVNIGDARFPTNFKKVMQLPFKTSDQKLTFDLTLNAGDEVSLTFDSSKTWSVDSKPTMYHGEKLSFEKLTVTGPHKINLPKKIQAITSNTAQLDTVEKKIKAWVKALCFNDISDAEVDDVAEKIKALNLSELEQRRMILEFVLCSPYFLYKNEDRVKLNELDFSKRLASFLWNSIPDDQLMSHASAVYQNNTALENEVKRMLLDPKSDRFIEDFIQQWLSTDRIEVLAPDMRVYKTIHSLQIKAMAKEPVYFFKEILHHNLSMMNFIDSDFIMCNDQLSEFYHVGKVEGHDFKRVKLENGHLRGGLISQAGFLKQTSNAFETSPIQRGVWILKNIYGEEMIPPANVQIEEPDIRGAKNLKEIMSLHQKSNECYRCHSKIDPFGLALEHFDPVGQYRNEYRKVTIIDTEKVAFENSPIDSKAKLKNGQMVSDMASLKKVLSEDHEKIIKNILSRLYSYSKARELCYQDHEIINEIYHTLKPQNFLFKDALLAMVTHPCFKDR